MQLEKKGSRRDLTKQVHEIRSKQGQATWKQRLNIEKALKESPSCLLGIARKLVDIKKGKVPIISQVVRTRESQSFVIKWDDQDYIISQERKNNIWVAS